ncbi:MAG: c-type cytochrome biogenesis protein CcsB [Pseudonocardiales bacterium]|nr:c-type cytochrome biogenesis protein CcsB [Pseudonocardiales bacterium]
MIGPAIGPAIGSAIVNEGFATFSDYAFRTALVLYLVAMVAHLGEYARERVAAAAVPVTVGAPTPTPVSLSPDQTRSTRSRAERFGRTGVALTILGAGLHVTSLVLRGAAVYRWPWGNMYEFSSAICLVAVLGWLVVLFRSQRGGSDRAPEVRRLGAFVLLPVVVLLFLAGTVLYADAAPVMPALRSYWLAIHVTAASISSGMFLVAGVASALFLVPRSPDPDGTAGVQTGVVALLPARDVLDRVAYRMTVIAFPIWTFAVMTGAIWAEAAWGKFWGWDPKETVAFVAWVVYAGYLHARATAGWRGGGAAWVNVLGFAVMLFNLFFVNLVTAGLHSYAGLD